MNIIKIKVATFNLFQFCEPNFSFYSKKEKFTIQDWEEKKLWIKNQILDLDAHIIGFQEVFSQKELEILVKECGFKKFIVADIPLLDEQTKTYKTTTVAMASKFPITNIEKLKTKNNFSFAREPIKAKIIINNKKLNIYVAHLKSNRLNEFEYKFTKNSNFEEKIEKLRISQKNSYSKSLNQRINEVKHLHFDIKNSDIPAILLCDLNDKEFSITIEALCNHRFYNKDLKKDEFILFDTYNLAPKKIYNPHPELKEIKRTPTSYFVGYGNTLDFIFVSKELKNSVTSYKVFDKHLEKNRNGSLKTSDHAQVLCEIEI
ncbi:endonuclease/exonuclease/phosphatase family protein [Aliarcobacter trophiarum]|uniref:Endonuclease/exonuclease/phosphatase n=1 Tax=Aliarcobacter trophiarum LMG 25534 TaxID=1032241 RepID=A0AAD0VMJ3_9BACT|nr:endonuclease/exonuclease/phosphatase family protein [Aliarcobacter trophiarum]AXK49294.1 endonuclease/exonuclease/phosphatase [Aliarcobacter trophiarum LMG 25534]